MIRRSVLNVVPVLLMGAGCHLILPYTSSDDPRDLGLPDAADLSLDTPLDAVPPSEATIVDAAVDDAPAMDLVVDTAGAPPGTARWSTT